VARTGDGARCEGRAGGPRPKGSNVDAMQANSDKALSNSPGDKQFVGGRNKSRLREGLAECLKKLPRAELTVLLLAVADGCSPAEIADATGRTADEVARLLGRAREAVALALRKG